VSAGRLVAAGGVGLFTAWTLGRLFRRRRSRSEASSSSAPVDELEPWEREALELGDVSGPEGHPDFTDEVPVGRGTPAETCVTLGASESGESEDPPAPHCLLDPLSDVRFAPVDRGAPASTLPSSSTWPVLTSHSGRLVVSYWTAGGVRGYSGRAFAAKRVDDDGPRRHAGIDLFARKGDVVVAPEDGRVLAILPFHSGTWAVYLRTILDDRVINLGEVEKLSWREFGITPGQVVQEGQALARIGVQNKGSTMLHVETYAVDGIDDDVILAAIRARTLSWPADAPAPEWLRDPSAYLLTAARRTYQREALGV
jgi:hypothetical protein